MTNAVVTKENQQLSSRDSLNLRTYTPAVEIYQNNESIVLLAEMPGVDEESVEITYERGILEIKGSAHRDSFEDYSLVRSEAPLGNYKRTFKLIEDVDVENIEASIKCGVLKLVLPIHEKAKPRKITVRAE